jgi:methyl-accepting chemotaxis protein
VARTRQAVQDVATAVDQQHAGINAICGAVTEVTANMGQAQSRLSGTVNATAEVKEVSREILTILKSYRV